jgi:hypothetical protein
MATVMFESENMYAVGKRAIVNCVWKARKEATAYFFLDDPPTFRSVQNHRDCPVCFVQKLDA